MVLVTHLSPQSSHSSTGFHPNLLWHKSHLATSPLEKKKSNGLQPASDGWLVLLVIPCETPVGIFFPDAPGLMSVNRWSITDGASERIVDPPSVAAAIDGAFRMEDDRAVWNESIESIESVGPLGITISSSPAGLIGRSVMMEESEGGTCPAPLTTEVL